MQHAHICMYVCMWKTILFIAEMTYNTYICTYDKWIKFKEQKGSKRALDTPPTSRKCLSIQYSLRMKWAPPFFVSF